MISKLLKEMKFSIILLIVVLTVFAYFASAGDIKPAYFETADAHADYNPTYSFHLASETISFFDVAIEVCDASTGYVEEHLDEACGPFLPGCLRCPWSGRLVKEIGHK
ncbi:hypothetical protein PPL_02943 [Heterostelium album PN500]|uniref:BP74 N-terminal domain-containing protein n=1 Tax=Heterostelium pallidum (strain ATCC 26659 / Pp 5 / PN500) TaxID=670386 RepID=D3B3H5_HETP5|nr:hypothetical protein PPL_02943 [Heterostelium album PN500]EFA83873.1 hypothetical protein PPL_02943 [Heterostelium album PN500]|eukprot:XP_020435990.1 hypothetical protein PPL_02943 [Heterostelium album PN500]